MVDNYLSSVCKQFLYYKTLGERSFHQIPEEALFWQYNAESNSIAVIVNHMAGNMLSRWTDFLNSDGEKSWRNRDQEFEDLIQDKVEMIRKWDEGWNCLFEAIHSVNEENFDQLVYIRNQGHTITEAINRQMAHYAYHVGQIVYIARMVAGENWESLSIPKGESSKYNNQKFSQKKRRGHFTEEFLNEPTTDDK